MIFRIMAISIILIVLFPFSVHAKEISEKNWNEIVKERMSYYLRFQNVYIPWYYLAAIDQYERNIQSVRSDIPKRDSVVAIQFSEEFWVGPYNVDLNDTDPSTIQYFGGNGVDGDGDRKADPNNDADVMYTMVNYLSSYGAGEDNFKEALWEYYKSEKVIHQILTIAELYKHFNTINLDKHVFPVPVRGYSYSYKNTWGAARGWGGRRIHEGTDIFASYGTPVVSTSYGVIEVMGWNNFGGWRIGIRDNHNTYHYYAHLAYFNKELKEGDIVKPGTVLGAVGNSGYGKEGTTGKFPPHLHYGMYKFNGRSEWSFNPYPSLAQWEKETKHKR